MCVCSFSISSEEKSNELQEKSGWLNGDDTVDDAHNVRLFGRSFELFGGIY